MKGCSQMSADKAQVWLFWFGFCVFWGFFLLAFASDSKGLLARYVDN